MHFFRNKADGATHGQTLIKPDGATQGSKFRPPYKTNLNGVSGVPKVLGYWYRVPFVLCDEEHVNQGITNFGGRGS